MNKSDLDKIQQSISKCADEMEILEAIKTLEREAARCRVSADERAMYLLIEYAKHRLRLMAAGDHKVNHNFRIHAKKHVDRDLYHALRKASEMSTSEGRKFMKEWAKNKKP